MNDSIVNGFVVTAFGEPRTIPTCKCGRPSVVWTWVKAAFVGRCTFCERVSTYKQRAQWLLQMHGVKR